MVPDVEELVRRHRAAGHRRRRGLPVEGLGGDDAEGRVARWVGAVGVVEVRGRRGGLSRGLLQCDCRGRGEGEEEG